MTTTTKRPDGGEINHEAIETVRKAAFALRPAEQYRLATFVAENVGYALEREPDHPDSPHATPTNESPAPQAVSGWHDVKLELPEFDQPVVCTDGTRYWLDVRKDYMPELTCSGHIATHWWPYSVLNTKKEAKI